MFAALARCTAANGMPLDVCAWRIKSEGVDNSAAIGQFRRYLADATAPNWFLSWV